MQPVFTAGPLNLGLPELLVIGAVFVLLFGGKKIGDLGKGLGEGIRNFKEAMKDEPKADKKDEKTVEAKQ
jgi:sec-independent protein translocase protein TatA